MKPPPRAVQALRRYRNSRLYRPLARTLRVYNKRLVQALQARGFEDFSPAFPRILSNLDTQGSRVGLLAARAGLTRQAAGQLIAEIERCGYVKRRPATDDARATIVRFTPRGRRLLENVFELVEAMEAGFAAIVGQAEFERLKLTLARIADHVDPDGAFGAADE
jgi:DNA-binding MarR family transcriptional regulator